MAGERLGQYLLQQAGVPPATQPGAPPTSPQDAARLGIQDITQQALGQQLTGLQDVLTPSPRQAAAPPFSPSERLTAQSAAAGQLRGGIQQIRQVPEQLGQVEGGAGAMPPEDAARLGLTPGTATTKTRGLLGTAFETGLQGLDIAGSQIGRPHQFLTHAALAGAQGSQWDDAIQEGLIGATGYGLHNPRYVNFNNVLTALGVEPGVVYKGAGILPQWDERSMLGFVGDMILDPINFITFGASKAFGLLPKTGKWLTRLGREALMGMEHAGVLSENPEVRAFLAYRGRHDLVDALDKIRPATQEILESPRPSVLARHRPALRKAFDAVTTEVTAAAKEGKLGYPSPEDPSIFRPIRHFDPLLTEAHQNRLSDLLRDDPKLARAYLDPGGVHVAGQPIPGASEATAAIPGLLARGAAGTAKATEAAGRSIATAGLRRTGAFIERKPAQVERAVDAVGTALSTIWRLPPRFARFLQTDYYAKSRQAEYLLRRQGESIFRGLSTADAEGLTKAIDSRQLPKFLAENPDLRETADAMYKAQQDLWNAQVARGLQDPAAARDNYVYHYYKNTAKFRQILSESQLAQPGSPLARPGIRGARTHDPSTYQRIYDTLGDAEAAGLQPEYDIRRLFMMRQVNGWRSVIAHDFLKGTVTKFSTLIKPSVLKTGEILNPEDVISLTSAAAGETIKKPERIADLIQQGAVDVTDPAVTGPIAQRLAEEGQVPLETLKTLPADLQRQFFLERFRLAASRGGEPELRNVQAKYRDFQTLWPKGDAHDVLGDTFGLPKLGPHDGRYVTVPVELAPGSRVMATLPERIVRKLKAIQQGGVFNSEAGGPLRDMLRAYDRFLLNPFRKVTTAPRPAFHVRNAVSNILQSGMDIGLTILDPTLHAEATAILRGVKGGPIRTTTGEVLTRDQLMSEFIRYGGANTFYKRTNITGGGAAQQLADEIVAAHGAWRYVNPIYIGRTVGTAIENEARLAHFLALRKDGLSAPAAMERVLKFLFDYDQLTPVQRDFFRRFVPFWTWQSKNLALQTRQLVTNPRIANGYYRFFNSFQQEKNPEKVYLARDLFPQYLRNQFAISAGEGRAPQMTRWIMGLDLPIRDLNRFWNGDLASTFQNEWLNNVGPIPGAGEALYAMMGGEEGDQDIQRGIDAGAPAYRALALTRRLPALAPLADWLDVHEGFDPQGRAIIKANPAKVKALAILTVMDSPIRDLSRFMDAADSPISASVRYLTGARFEEMNPEAERRRRLKGAYDRASQYLGSARRDVTTYYTKHGAEPGREMERGPAPTLAPGPPEGEPQ